MKIKHIILLVFTAVFVPFSAGLAEEQAEPTAIVALGDSLTAGTQDAATLEPTQRAGWLSVLALQAGKIMPVHYVVPVMDAESVRTYPSEMPTNFSVPGLEVQEAMTATGSIDLIDGVPIDIGPFLSPSAANTTPLGAFQNALKGARSSGMRTWAFVWLGSNNALFDFTKVQKLTLQELNKHMMEPEKFSAFYRELLGEVTAVFPDVLFVAMIPDILKSGFLFTTADLSFYLKKQVTEDLLDPRSLVPLTSAASMLMGLQAGTPADVLIHNLDASEVLDAEEQGMIRARIDAYNRAIRIAAEEAGAILIDADETINVLLQDGMTLKSGKRVFRSWNRGGLFSLDGMHPSNTGHALIANMFMNKINETLGLSIPEADIEKVYEADPYRDMDGDGYVPGPTWKPAKRSIASILRIFTDKDDQRR